MPVTFTVTPRHVYSIGDRKEVIADVACTGTPTVGGDALTGAALGLNQVDTVDAVGAAGVVGGTSGTAVQVIHSTTAFSTSSAGVPGVLIVFLVQGTAGAANSMLAYTGATAGFVFRVRAVGKGLASAAAS
jgi:hypothetical protein